MAHPAGENEDFNISASDERTVAEIARDDLGGVRRGPGGRSSSSTCRPSRSTCSAAGRRWRRRSGCSAGRRRWTCATGIARDRRVAARARAGAGDGARAFVDRRRLASPGAHLLRHLLARRPRRRAVARRAGPARRRGGPRRGARDARPDTVWHLGGAGVGRRARGRRPRATLAENVAMTAQRARGRARRGARGDGGADRLRRGLRPAGAAAGGRGRRRCARRTRTPSRRRPCDLLGGQYADATACAWCACARSTTPGPGQSDDYVVGTITRQVAEAEAAGGAEAVAAHRQPRLAARLHGRARRGARLRRGRELEPGAYNVASGRAVSVRELIELVRAAARIPVRHEVDPARVRAPRRARGARLGRAAARGHAAGSPRSRSSEPSRTRSTRGARSSEPRGDDRDRGRRGHPRQRRPHRRHARARSTPQLRDDDELIVVDNGSRDATVGRACAPRRRARGWSSRTTAASPAGPRAGADLASARRCCCSSTPTPRPAPGCVDELRASGGRSPSAGAPGRRW